MTFFLALTKPMWVLADSFLPLDGEFGGLLLPELEFCPFETASDTDSYEKRFAFFLPSIGFFNSVCYLFTLLLTLPDFSDSGVIVLSILSCRDTFDTFETSDPFETESVSPLAMLGPKCYAKSTYSFSFFSTSLAIVGFLFDF